MIMKAQRPPRELPPEVPLSLRVVPTNFAGDGIACEVIVERKAAA